MCCQEIVEDLDRQPDLRLQFRTFKIWHKMWTTCDFKHPQTLVENFKCIFEPEIRGLSSLPKFGFRQRTNMKNLKSR